MTGSSTWSAPVRYAEVDQQGVVFNAHYLLYCDEALAAFCAARSLERFAADVQLKRSTLTWSGPARFGDVVSVDVGRAHVGTTSLTLTFDVQASGRACCTVETVYVLTDGDGAPAAVDDATRAALLS